ncbi:phage terminase small subunit P27 family [Larkinella humicola]|uniref:Phage terminase small subunit P27 family n=1 Tax=Larkinella humicola TaxID=2607654 RepID=A0A5N1JM00_9BACT|nr:phage terminase small subunit P27 family [Larkinella humicola]KAA9357224.1 phage terminase small subunit P27 family [Larkinella humicola]
MARPPKPTAVKVLEGTYRKDRAIHDEVEPELLGDIPDPPDGLEELAVKEWYTVCRWLHSVGNLASTDLSLVAIYCNEIANYWEYDAIVKAKGSVIVFKDEVGNPSRVQANPYTALRKSSYDSAVRLAGQFGFTPSARSRIKAGKIEKPQSRLEKLKSKRGNR